MRAIGRNGALALTMALAAAGCATTQQAPVAVAPRLGPAPGPPPPTLDGAWNLAMVRGAPQGVRLAATLRIDADKAQGVTDCGPLSAQATNFGMDLRFDRLNADRSCADTQKLAAQRTFLDALASTRTVQMREGYLILMDQNGREQLYFARGGALCEDGRQVQRVRELTSDRRALRDLVPGLRRSACSGSRADIGAGCRRGSRRSG